MKNFDWKITTKSGTEYTSTGGVITVAGKPHLRYGTEQLMSSRWDEGQFDRPWTTPDAWEDVTVPVVGHRLFIGTSSTWLITSVVEALEEGVEIA